MTKCIKLGKRVELSAPCDAPCDHRLKVSRLEWGESVARWLSTRTQLENISNTINKYLDSPCRCHVSVKIEYFNSLTFHKVFNKIRCSLLWGQFRCFWYCDNNVLYNCKSQIVAIKNLLSVSSNCSQSTLMNKDALTHCSMIKVIFIVHNLIINTYTPFLSTFKKC